MSPTTEKDRGEKDRGDKNRSKGTGKLYLVYNADDHPDTRSIGTARFAPARSLPEESLDECLADDARNPWRNYADDQHIWLGFLLALVGLGSISYLISGF